MLIASQAIAQQKTVTGTVTSEQGTPLSGVSVVIKGTTRGTSTNAAGNYSLVTEVGQTLQFRFIGTALVERTVGEPDVIDVQLRRAALDLDAVVVTALGQTTTQRSLGYSQQSILGTAVAETQRENFVNALQGRIAGVDVTSTSGVPGASSSIVIRGVTSISGSNQPLIIVDGLPMDNRTLNTGLLASDANSNTALSNRGVDFTNRAADLDPNDIETLTVLKGPEAAALYGIDAGNGAIVITTKRGRAGGGVEYSSSGRVEWSGAKPQLQRVYGPSAVSTDGTLGSFFYFGSPVSRRNTVLRQHRRLPPYRHRRGDERDVQRSHLGQPHQLPTRDGRGQARWRRADFGLRPDQHHGGVTGPDRSLAEQRRVDGLHL
ncbi:MAG TPA: TonB-dependent receptor plug domain-containing protein [Gemmatimonadales bacterium]|nr:TonB-dependent receptor plug domain-containing protein [Gemmatimonadales bacterium]